MKYTDFPLLNAEKEREFIKKAQEGSKEHFDYLVMSNQGWVRRIAKTYKVNHEDFEDLMQVGTMALMHAIKKFDLSTNYKLSTYTTKWIQAHMTRYMQTSSKVVRTPAWLCELNKKVTNNIKRLEQDLNRKATEEEIIKELGISKKEFEKYKTSVIEVCSLNCPGDDGNGELGDSITETFKNETENLEMEELLNVIKSILNQKQYNVFVRKVGIESGYKITDEALGNLLGVSKQGINNMNQRSLEKLRNDPRIKLFI